MVAAVNLDLVQEPQLEEVVAVFAKEGQLQRRQDAPSPPLHQRVQSFCFIQRTLLASRSAQFPFW